MENMAHHEPSKLPYKLLKHITNDFGKERILGSGGFGKVYKGVYENGKEIAVKVLYSISGIDDKDFRKEFDNLNGLKHPNIVKLVGFCNESEEEFVVFKGQQVTAEHCFEYVHNGSLNKHISDEKKGFTWQTRYRIIKGICEGLKYLREGLDNPIMHFDLKPDNILLDEKMTPKIADFGLSRLFGEENTTNTINFLGTCGYWPPEYIMHQVISKEFDIFSLGVIIVKIMIGHEGYKCIADMSTQKFAKHVYERWKKRLRETLSHTSLEVYCNQVRRCIEIALGCLKSNRQERPAIQVIISNLNQTKIMVGDQGMKNEQPYQDDLESTFPSQMRNITINSRPSGHVEPSTSTYSGNFRAAMPWHLVKDITNNFSEERLISQGVHRKVYKGVYEDGQVVAVRILDGLQIDKEKFVSLVNIRHENIVRFIGYYEEEGVYATDKGKHIFKSQINTTMCFEYLPNGSLDRYIRDKSSGYDWGTCYRIIKGICEALRYLHEGLKPAIVHRNLKLTNILLDENMTPKIAHFGLNKLRNHDEHRRLPGRYLSTIL